MMVSLMTQMGHFFPSLVEYITEVQADRTRPKLIAPDHSSKSLPGPHRKLEENLWSWDSLGMSWESVNKSTEMCQIYSNIA